MFNELLGKANKATESGGGWELSLMREIDTAIVGMSNLMKMLHHKKIKARV